MLRIACPERRPTAQKFGQHYLAVSSLEHGADLDIRRRSRTDDRFRRNCQHVDTSGKGPLTTHCCRSPHDTGWTAVDRGCVKTLKSQQVGELFPLLPSFRSRPQRYSSLD